MIKYRMEITKGEEVRYISHLDFASLMQRAICRAKLPAAYSEGFNPHMKIAFASALSVGITSEKEYVDLELSKDLCQPEVFEKLAANLPPGVKLLRLKEVPLKSKALMSIVDEATYDVILPLEEPVEKIQEAVNKFNAESEIIIVRQTPKKTKEVEIKQYLPKDILVEADEANKELILKLTVKITPGGTAKTNEILGVLNERFGLHLNLEEALQNRTGLFHEGKALIDLDI